MIITNYILRNSVAFLIYPREELLVHPEPEVEGLPDRTDCELPGRPPKEFKARLLGGLTCTTP